MAEINTTDFSISLHEATMSISKEQDTDTDVMMVLSTTIASAGITANLTVVLVFSNDKKLRKKIPNIFIVHQVSHINT